MAKLQNFECDFLRLDALRGFRILVSVGFASCLYSADNSIAAVPKNLVPYSSRRVKGERYIYSGRPERIDMGPVNEIVNEARCRTESAGTLPRILVLSEGAINRTPVRSC